MSTRLIRLLNTSTQLIWLLILLTYIIGIYQITYYTKGHLKTLKEINKGSYLPSLRTQLGPNGAKTELFIVINSRNPSYIPVWLEDCIPPTCSYQIFVDNSTDFASVSHKGINQIVVEYPKYMQTHFGYSGFGFRGRYQMEWAIQNVDFDWYIKLDDDGYLCIDTLLYTLRNNNAPKKKFLYGRFWCKPGKVRPDENFLTLSRDAVEYFLVGWDKKLLIFDGSVTLGHNIGVQLSYLHHTCGWTFWCDHKSFRWYEKMKLTFSCNSHVWFHHVKPKLVKKLHVKYKEKPFDSTIKRNSTLYKNDTGCKNIGPGLPPYSQEVLENIDILEGTKKGNRKIFHTNFTKFRTLNDYC